MSRRCAGSASRWTIVSCRRRASFGMICNCQEFWRPSPGWRTIVKRSGQRHARSIFAVSACQPAASPPSIFCTARAVCDDDRPPPGDPTLAQSEIDAIRTLLGSKPRPVGWSERRKRIHEAGATWPVASDVKCEAVDCDGVAGEWSIVPGSENSRVLLYFHGGGYCSGSIVSHRRLVTEAGRAARTRTLAIDYRLAPEHPYPAAHDDALSAWRFLRRHGIAAKSIAVGGASAGGNLTLGLINRLRAAGEELPACAWLISPWTDLTMSGSTLATKDAIDPLIHKAYLEELAAAYLDAGMDRKDPRVSPLYADLRAFPQILIQVGSAEVLLGDATRFAAVAVAADVPMTLEIWPHMIHAWHLWNARLEPGRRALVNAGAFIQRH